MYEVIFTRPARKDLEALPSRTQDRILEAIEKLRDSPRPRGCKKLRGTDYTFRIRAGAYRVIYDVYDKEVRVFVIRVRHRKDAYE